jgi:hypothetical protein
MQPLEDAMRHLTLRHNAQIAAIATLLIGAIALPAIAQETTARPATISHAVPTDAHLPAASMDIDAVTPDSDITVFLHPDVPDDVHRAALRRLWAVMDLPVSCQDLCTEASASGLPGLTGETLPIVGE